MSMKQIGPAKLHTTRSPVRIQQLSQRQINNHSDMREFFICNMLQNQPKMWLNLQMSNNVMK